MNDFFACCYLPYDSSVHIPVFFGPLYCTTQNKSLTGLLEKKFDFTSSWVLQQMTIHKLLKSTHEPEKKNWGMGFGENIKLPSKSIHKNNTISIGSTAIRQTSIRVRVRGQKSPAVEKFVTKDNWLGINWLNNPIGYLYIFFLSHMY